MVLFIWDILAQIQEGGVLLLGYPAYKHMEFWISDMNLEIKGFGGPVDLDGHRNICIEGTNWEIIRYTRSFLGQVVVTGSAGLSPNVGIGYQKQSNHGQLVVLEGEGGSSARFHFPNNFHPLFSPSGSP